MAKAVFLRTFCKNLAAFLLKNFYPPHKVYYTSARVERFFEFFLRFCQCLVQ